MSPSPKRAVFSLDDLARSRYGQWLPTVALAAAFALAAGSAAQKSVTVDEFQALPHGLAIWKTGDLHLATGVPLLPSVAAALPLTITRAPLDTAAMAGYTSPWQCGAQFQDWFLPGADRSPPAFEPAHYHDYFLIGRLVSLAALLVTCALTYGYARSLYGAGGGLVAAVFTCLSPNLLAHGPLVTPDIYLTAAIVGTLWAFDRLLQFPGGRSAAMLGTALGLAALSKLTGLLLFGILPVLVLLLQFTERGLFNGKQQPRASARGAIPLATPMFPIGARHWGRTWLALCGALALGLLVIHAGYRFGGSLTMLKKFHFASQQMQTVQGLLPGWLPVPLPYYFFLGIDEQLAETGYTAYLSGQFNDTGFYRYYLVGLLVKTPEPVLMLGLLAAIWGGRPRARELPFVATALLLFAFFSLSRHKNIGMRYVLFLEPLLAVWISRLAATAQKPLRAAWALGVGAAVLLVANLCVWPDYLAYFNLASGGPDHGHKYLLDSNLDWGQDLTALRRYLEREGIDSIDLAYFGRVRPEVYGIHYHLLGGPQPPQRYAVVSANLLWGLMYFVNGTGIWPQDSNTFAAFRRMKPKAVVRHTLYVFDLEQLL